MSLGGMRPSGGDSTHVSLYARCTKCGQESGPFGEAPDACENCGADQECLDFDLRDIGWQ